MTRAMLAIFTLLTIIYTEKSKISELHIRPSPSTEQISI